MDFAQHNTERAVQATNWMRTIAEQNLNQSKAAFEGLLTIARNAVGSVDQQAAFIRDSMSFAEKTLENTFHFAHNLIRMKDPQELAQIQSEFIDRQAQLVGDRTKELGQMMTKRVDDATKTMRETAAESSRRRPEAA
jgi:hypothetical protein